MSLQSPKRPPSGGLVRVHVGDVIKTIVVDVGANVRDVVRTIAEKVHAGSGHDLGLQAESSPGVWLRPNTPLSQQVAPDEAVVLKRRLFSHESQIDKSKVVLLQLAFEQCKDHVMTGAHGMTIDDAGRLSALLAILFFGPYDPVKHKLGTTPLEKIVPPQWMAHAQELEPVVLQQWMGFGALGQSECKAWYLQTCRALRNFGMQFYHVSTKDARSSKTAPMKLGLSSSSVLLLRHDGKNTVLQHDFAEVVSCEATRDTLTIDFGPIEDPLVLNTLQAPEIADTIDGYLCWQKALDGSMDDEGEPSSPSMESDSTSPGLDGSTKLSRSNPIDVRVTPPETSQSPGVKSPRSAGMAQRAEDPILTSITEVKSLQAAKAIFADLLVLINKRLVSIGVETGKIALKQEQVVQQLSSHMEEILELLPEIMAVQSGADTSTQMGEVARKLTLATYGLVQTVLASSTKFADLTMQHNLLEAGKNAVDKLASYATAVQSIMPQPQQRISPGKPHASGGKLHISPSPKTNSAKKKSEETSFIAQENATAIEIAAKEQQEIEVALTNVLGAARTGTIDEATESLIIELARNVKICSDGLCENAVPESGDNPKVIAACKTVRDAGVAFVQTIRTFSRVCLDDTIKEKINQRLSALRKSLAVVLAEMSLLKKNMVGLQMDMVVFTTALKMLENFTDKPHIQMDPVKLAFLRSARSVLREVDAIANMEGITRDAQQSIVVLKQQLPTFVAHAKSPEFSPKVRERLMHIAQQITLAVKQVIVVTLPEQHCTSEQIREATTRLWDTVLEFLKESSPDNLFNMQRITLIDRTKVASAACLVFKYNLRLIVVRLSDKYNMEQLGAAGLASDTMVDLINKLHTASSNAGDVKGNTRMLAEAAEIWATGRILIPGEVADLDSSDPGKHDLEDSIITLKAALKALSEEAASFGKLQTASELSGAFQALDAAQARLDQLRYSLACGKLSYTQQRDPSKLPRMQARMTDAVKKIEAAVHDHASVQQGAMELSVAAQQVVIVVRGIVAQLCTAPEAKRAIAYAADVLVRARTLLSAVKGLASNPTDDAKSEAVTEAVTDALISIQSFLLAATEDDMSKAKASLENAKRAAEDAASVVLPLGSSAGLFDPLLELSHGLLCAVHEMMQEASHSPDMSDPRTVCTACNTLACTLASLAHAVSDINCGIDPEELVTYAQTILCSSEALYFALRNNKTKACVITDQSARAVSQAFIVMVREARTSEYACGRGSEDSVAYDALVGAEIAKQIEVYELEARLAKEKKLKAAKAVKSLVWHTVQ
eukprot:m51a1_g4516 putative actin binding protein (1293) ;mRNA; r:417843-422570